MPNISLILSTNNRASLLKEMLCSVKGQSFLDWECLVIDDANDGNTKNVVAACADDRIQYFERPNKYNQGLSGSRNFGLKIATGEYVHFIDDDDVLHPNFLELKWNIVVKNQGIEYVISPLLNFTDRLPAYTKELPTHKNVTVNWKEYILGKSGIYSCSVLWKATCFDHNQFNESLKVSEDWDLYRVLFKRYVNGVELNLPLYFRRVHANTNSGQLRANNKVYNADYIKTRKTAFFEILDEGELNRELALFFMYFALRYKLDDVENALKNWNNKSAVFTLKDKFDFLKSKWNNNLKRNY